MRFVELAKVLADPGAFGVTLLLAVVDTYGTEAAEWHPAALRAELAKDTHATVPPPSFNRLMAAMTVMRSNGFYKRLPEFAAVCNVLASGDASDAGDPPEAAECAWGITEAALIHPPDEDEPFVPEIRAYLAAVLDNEGFVTAPDVLRLASGSNGRGAKMMGEWADDPTMASAAWTAQAGKAEEVSDMIRLNLIDLFGQLRHLDLENGDARHISAAALAKLQAA